MRQAPFTPGCEKVYHFYENLKDSVRKKENETKQKNWQAQTLVGKKNLSTKIDTLAKC